MDDKTALSLSPEELSWVKGYPEAWRAAALLVLRYAHAFNELDATWLRGCLAPAVTYASQSVFQELAGRTAVWEYLSGKIAALRSEGKDSMVRVELGSDAMGGKPCAIVLQANGPHDKNWVDRPLAYLTIEANSEGNATKLFMVTAVPPPASARRTGVFPGAKSLPKWQPLRRATADYLGLKFHLFVWDGKPPLDTFMIASLEGVLQRLPGAALRVIRLETANEEESEVIAQLGIVSFPELAVYWEDTLVWQGRGLMGADAVERAVKSLFDEQTNAG